MTDSADGLLDQRHTPGAADEQSSADVSRLMPEVASIEDELRRLAADQDDRGALDHRQPPSRLRGADASKAVLAAFASLDEPEPTAPLPDTHHESDPEEEMVEEGGPVVPEYDDEPGPDTDPESAPDAKPGSGPEDPDAEPDAEPLPEPEQLEPPDPAVDPSARLTQQPSLPSLPPLPPLSPSTQAILAALNAATAATEAAPTDQSAGVVRTTAPSAATEPPAPTTATGAGAETGTVVEPGPAPDAETVSAPVAEPDTARDIASDTAPDAGSTAEPDTEPEAVDAASENAEPTTSAAVPAVAAGAAPGRRKASRARLWGRRHSAPSADHSPSPDSPDSPDSADSADAADRLNDEPSTATHVPDDPSTPEIPSPDTPDLPDTPETPEPPQTPSPPEPTDPSGTPQPPDTTEPGEATEPDRLERLIEASAPAYHDRRSPAEIAEALGARPAVAPDRLAMARTALAEPSSEEHYFRPRRGSRRVLSLLLTIGLAATVITCWWAISMRSLPSILVAAAVGVVTALIWAMRASDPPTRLHSVGSRLVIERSGTRAQFDLADPHTPVVVHGRPGDSDWSVTFTRRSLPSVVIDRSAVDPTEFMTLFDRYRPQL